MPPSLPFSSPRYKTLATALDMTEYTVLLVVWKSCVCRRSRSSSRSGTCRHWASGCKRWRKRRSSQRRSRRVWPHWTRNTHVSPSCSPLKLFDSLYEYLQYILILIHRHTPFAWLTKLYDAIDVLGLLRLVQYNEYQYHYSVTSALAYCVLTTQADYCLHENVGQLLQGCCEGGEEA